MEKKRYVTEQFSSDTILMDVIHETFRFLFTDEFGQCLLAMLGIHYATCVLDTNFILRDISWTLKKQQHSSLILAARVGTLRLYASTQVRAEVPKKLYARATQLAIDPEMACQMWKTTYKPLIRFLDPGELYVQSRQIEELRQRDPDDLPTAQLIELLRPAVVFSEDQDLAAFGSIRVPATQMTTAYRDHAERDAQFVMLGLGGGVALRMSLAMLSLLARLLLRLNGRGAIILGTIMGLLFVIPPTRRALLSGIQAVKERLQDAFQDVHLDELLDNVVEGIMEMENNTKEARTFLLQQERHIAPSKKALEYLIGVPSLTGEALSVQEITQRMIVWEYEPRGRVPETYIRRLLRTHPQLFACQKDRRWSITTVINEPEE